MFEQWNLTLVVTRLIKLKAKGLHKLAMLIKLVLHVCYFYYCIQLLSQGKRKSVLPAAKYKYFIPEDFFALQNYKLMTFG